MAQQRDTTFCGAPFAEPEALEADVAVIGAPHGTPYKPGASRSERDIQARGAQAIARLACNVISVIALQKAGARR